MKHSKTDENGHRLVVRNDYHPQRSIVTGIGPMTIKAPRVDDRKIDPERKNPFTSAILPRYLREIPSIDNLLPKATECLRKDQDDLFDFILFLVFTGFIPHNKSD